MLNFRSTLSWTWNKIIVAKCCTHSCRDTDYGRWYNSMLQVISSKADSCSVDQESWMFVNASTESREEHYPGPVVYNPLPHTLFLQHPSLKCSFIYVWVLQVFHLFPWGSPHNNWIRFLYYSVCQQQRAYDRQTLINIYIKKEQIKIKSKTKNQSTHFSVQRKCSQSR
jgi:hypothetical protein